MESEKSIGLELHPIRLEIFNPYCEKVPERTADPSIFILVCCILAEDSHKESSMEESESEEDELPQEEQHQQPQLHNQLNQVLY